MKFGKKLLGIASAATVAASTAFGGAFVQSVGAADQIPNGAEGIVAIHINGKDGGRDVQSVDYDFHGDDHGYTHAPDLGVYPQNVYCILPTRNPGADATKNQHFRWRWNLNANAWVFDNNRGQLENQDYAPDSSQLAGLAAIIDYGQTNGYSYGPIQDAVYWYVCFGNGSAPDHAGQQYQNEITDAYKNGTAKAPASYGLYMYVSDSEVTEMVQNTIGLAVWSREDETTTTTQETTTTTEEETTTTTEEETTTTKKEDETTTTKKEDESTTTTKDDSKGSLKTTVSVDGNSSSASAAVEIEAGTKDVVDKIDYTGLTGGATYTVSGSLICTDDESVVAEASEELVADDSGAGTWEITFKSVTLEAGKSYVVYESAVNKDDSTDKAEHKDINDKSQTIVVKSEAGNLATTVNAAGKNGSADAAARLTYDEALSTTSVTDTITYTGLVKGATYTVTGKLVEVDANGNITNEEVATNTVDLVAEDTDGTWTMNFDNVTLKSYSKYVVFESAYTKGGEDENATEENPITHENIKDLAQTIVTEDENGKIFDENEEGTTTVTKTTTDDASKIKESQGSSRKGTGGPSTGDSSNTALYITAAAAAAGIAVTAVVLGTRKRSRR